MKTEKDIFEHRLESATEQYKVACQKGNKYNIRSWLKRIKWCDSQLAKLGEW